MLVEQNLVEKAKSLKGKKRGNLLTSFSQTEAKPILKELEQIEIIRKSVEVEIVSLESISQVLQNYLPSLVQAVENGLESPLSAFSQIRKIAHLADFWLESLKSLALKEAEQLHKDELYELGFEISNTGDILNFAEDAEIQNLETQLKRRKDLIKSATRHQKTILDEASGEMIKPVSIKTPSSSYLKTLKAKN